MSVAAPTIPSTDACAQATVAAAFASTVAERASETALRTPGGAITITWQTYAERSARIAAGLAGLGVRRGDRVGFMLTNRPEFNLADCAALQLGAACFSIYNTFAPEQIAYLLRDAAPRVVVCEAQFLERLTAAIAQAGTTPRVVLVDSETPASETLTLAALEAGAAPGFDIEAARAAIEPDDALALIYTSGTTGPPKGVTLTHANVLAEVRALQAVARIAPGGSNISYLPAAHVADRLISHWWSSICLGFTLTCCADMREVFAVVPDAQPTVFGGVPRIWEKLKAALEASFAAEADAARRGAVQAAVETGLARVRAEQAGTTLSADVAERDAALEPVRAAIRGRLGLGACEYYVAGAAATPAEVLEFFAAIGIPICELWGMSETTAVATLNPRDAIRIGTVGPPLPGVELRLADDGEVFVRGPMVMKGYLNLPEKTAETIDPEGWLATGDIGTIDRDGYLKIVDRKKELIINAAGKNMSPANIEAALKTASPLIGQACAIGDGRPYNTALIVLDPDAAAAFARAHGIDDTSLATLAQHAAVRDEVEAAVARGNAKLARVEQIKRFAILPADWPAGGDELTPTMKLKRKPIATKYASEIERLYSAPAR